MFPVISTLGRSQRAKDNEHMATIREMYKVSGRISASSQRTIRVF